MENSDRTKIPTTNYGWYAFRCVALLLWRLIGTLRSSLFEREDDILSVYSERRGNLVLFVLLVIFVIGFLVFLSRE